MTVPALIGCLVLFGFGLIPLAAVVIVLYVINKTTINVLGY